MMKNRKEFKQFTPATISELGKFTQYSDADTNHIERLHLHLTQTEGEELLKLSSCFIITRRFKDILNDKDCTGFETEEVLLTIDSSIAETWNLNQVLPVFLRLKVTGTAFQDDFGLDKEGELVISQNVYSWVAAEEEDTDSNELEEEIAMVSFTVPGSSETYLTPWKEEYSKMNSRKLTNKLWELHFQEEQDKENRYRNKYHLRLSPDFERMQQYNYYLQCSHKKLRKKEIWLGLSMLLCLPICFFFPAALPVLFLPPILFFSQLRDGRLNHRRIENIHPEDKNIFNKLIAGVVVDTNPVQLLVMMDNHSEPGQPLIWRFRKVTIGKLPGLTVESGERVPCGLRLLPVNMDNPETNGDYDMIGVPYPVTWATEDRKYVEKAIKLIPSQEWDILEKMTPKVMTSIGLRPNKIQEDWIFYDRELQPFSRETYHSLMLLEHIQWKFEAETYDTLPPFLEAVKEVQHEPWDTDKVILESPVIVISYSCKEDESEEYQEILFGLASDHPVGFTAGELLFKLHNYLADKLDPQKETIFAGLFLNTEVEAEVPFYSLRLSEEWAEIECDFTPSRSPYL